MQQSLKPLSNIGEELASIRIITLCRSTAVHMLKLYPDDFIERTVYHLRRILPLRAREYVYIHNVGDLTKPVCFHIYHWPSKPDEYFDGHSRTELYDVKGLRHSIHLSYNINAALASTNTNVEYEYPDTFDDQKCQFSLVESQI